ncbi:unnamed protein product, partial [Prorocentrum cordatum]
ARAGGAALLAGGGGCPARASARGVRGQMALRSPPGSARSYGQGPRALRPSPRSLPPASGRRSRSTRGSGRGGGRLRQLRAAGGGARQVLCGLRRPGRRAAGAAAVLHLRAAPLRPRALLRHLRPPRGGGGPRPALPPRLPQPLPALRAGGLAAELEGVAAGPHASPRALSPRTVASILSQVSPRSPRMGRRGRPDWVPPLSAYGARSPRADTLGNGIPEYQQEERPHMWPSAWPGTPPMMMMLQPSPGRSVRSHYAASSAATSVDDLQIVPYSGEAPRGKNKRHQLPEIRADFVDLRWSPLALLLAPPLAPSARQGGGGPVQIQEIHADLRQLLLLLFLFFLYSRRPATPRPSHPRRRRSGLNAIVSSPRTARCSPRTARSWAWRCWRTTQR